MLNLRSASFPAPGLLASKSPPSAAKPVAWTTSCPVAFLSSPSLPSSFLSSVLVSSVTVAGLSVAPASPPCSRATASTGLGPGPTGSVRVLSWTSEASGFGRPSSSDRRFSSFS